MDEIDSLLENYTSLGSQGTCVITRDILASQKFQYKFPDVFPMNSDGNDDKFLKALAKDYQASKDKETSKLIRAQGAKITQKLLIGGSLKGSNLQVDGVTRGKSRTETAKAIGRVSMFGDERRRLLSIVGRTFHSQHCNHIFFARREPLLQQESTPYCLAEVVPLEMA